MELITPRISRARANIGFISAKGTLVASVPFRIDSTGKDRWGVRAQWRPDIHTIDMPLLLKLDSYTLRGSHVDVYVSPLLLLLLTCLLGYGLYHDVRRTAGKASGAGFDVGGSNGSGTS
jgi:hypothetical protein